MTMKALSERLASLCAEPKLETPAGRILVPGQPVDLLEELTGVLEEDAAEREEELLWNGFADVATRWWGPEVWRPAMEFLWQGLGPVIWDASLAVLRIEGLSFLALPIDDWGNPERVIARLEPEPTGELLGAFLVDAARSNGRRYGFDLFGSPPSRTIDHTGVPRDLIAAAYTRWLDHNSGLMSWLELRDWLLAEIDEPDPLTRGLKMIRGLEERGINGILDDKERMLRESATLSADQKRFILDAFLDRTLSRRIEG